MLGGCDAGRAVCGCGAASEDRALIVTGSWKFNVLVVPGQVNVGQLVN